MSGTEPSPWPITKVSMIINVTQSHYKETYEFTVCHVTYKGAKIFTHV